MPGVSIMSFKVTQLKAELEKRGLEKSGVKSALIEKLRQVLLDEGLDPDDYDPEKFDSAMSDDLVSQMSKNSFITDDDVESKASSRNTSRHDLRSSYVHSEDHLQEGNSDIAHNVSKAPAIQENKHPKPESTMEEVKGLRQDFMNSDNGGGGTVPGAQGSQSNSAIDSQLVSDAAGKTSPSTGPHDEENLENDPKRKKVPAKKAAKSPQNLIWVGNIGSNVSAADLKSLFSQCGKVSVARIVTVTMRKDTSGGAAIPVAEKMAPTCYGYLEMVSPEDVETCIHEMDGTDFKNQTLAVATTLGVVKAKVAEIEEAAALKKNKPVSKPLAGSRATEKNQVSPVNKTQVKKEGSAGTRASGSSLPQTKVEERKLSSKSGAESSTGRKSDSSTDKTSDAILRERELKLLSKEKQLEQLKRELELERQRLRRERMKNTSRERDERSPAAKQPTAKEVLRNAALRSRASSIPSKMATLAAARLLAAKRRMLTSNGKRDTSPVSGRKRRRSRSRRAGRRASRERSRERGGCGHVAPRHSSASSSSLHGRDSLKSPRSRSPHHSHHSRERTRREPMGPPPPKYPRTSNSTNRYPSSTSESSRSSRTDVDYYSRLSDRDRDRRAHDKGSSGRHSEHERRHRDSYPPHSSRISEHSILSDRHLTEALLAASSRDRRGLRLMEVPRDIVSLSSTIPRGMRYEDYLQLLEQFGSSRSRRSPNGGRSGHRR